jgi:hypothetical protein
MIIGCVVTFILVVIGLFIKPVIESFVNPYFNVTDKGPPDPIVYQGHGIPIISDDHSTIPVESSMFYFKNYSCRPECCLYNTHSCSHGCVCHNPPPNHGYQQNMAITPRS